MNAAKIAADEIQQDKKGDSLPLVAGSQSPLFAGPAARRHFATWIRRPGGSPIRIPKYVLPRNIQSARSPSIGRCLSPVSLPRSVSVSPSLPSLFLSRTTTAREIKILSRKPRNLGFRGFRLQFPRPGCIDPREKVRARDSGLSIEFLCAKPVPGFPLSPWRLSRAQEENRTLDTFVLAA